MATQTNTAYSLNINTAIGGTPSAGDDIRITQDTAPAVYSEGLDAWVAVALASFFATLPCRTDLGTVAAPLELDADDVRIEHGHGFAHIAGVSGETIANMVLGSATGRASNYVADADITVLTCQAGLNYVEASADVGTARVNGGVTRIRSGGAKGTAFSVAAGATLYLGRDSAALTVSGTCVLDHADAAVDAATVNSGGRLRLEKARPAAVTLEAGAVLDMSESPTVFQSGEVVNINGPVTVIPPRAPSAGVWYGSATVNAPAGITVTESGAFSRGGVL